MTRTGITDVVSPAYRFQGVEVRGERYWSERDLLNFLARCEEMNEDAAAVIAFSLVAKAIRGQL